MRNSWFSVHAVAASRTADLYVVGEIGPPAGEEGVDVAALARQLRELPAAVTTVRVHVNSIGGDVAGAITLANTLRDVASTRRVEADVLTAVSAASLLVAPCQAVRIRDEGIMMVHEPSMLAAGNAAAMRNAAAALAKFEDAMVTTYEWRAALRGKNVRGLMEATTWMGPAEAVAHGFADEIAGVEEEAPPVAARFDPDALFRLGEIPARHLLTLNRIGARAARQLERPAPAPAPPRGAQPAARMPATEVVSVCAAAGVIELAEGLLLEGASAATVAARVALAVQARDAEAARVQAVRALCKLAHMPELGDDYVRGRVSVAAARDMLQRIRVRNDVDIDTSFGPDSVTARGGK